MILQRNVPAQDKGPKDVVPLFKVRPERSRREAYTADVAGYPARLAIPEVMEPLHPVCICFRRQTYPNPTWGAYHRFRLGGVCL